MKTLQVSNEVHKDWKVFCSKKEVSIVDATEIALKLAMKSKDIKSKS